MTMLSEHTEADTQERILEPEEYARTWYRPNPPWPVVEWSARDNNNYQQSALLATLDNFARNEHVCGAVVGIKLRTHFLVALAVVSAPCGRDCLLNNRKNGFFWQILLFSDRTDRKGELLDINVFHDVFSPFLSKNPTCRPECTVL